MEKNNMSAKEIYGEVAPRFAELSEDILFGDIWERNELSKRDRSLITIAALVALNRSEQLSFHLQLGLENKVTKEEMGELMTHLAFYSGWPTVATALIKLKEMK